ncbi:hypothetical protein [Sulfitobacter sp.]|uniref:hypothetical protein n=1 Tax=Sulfitobacter sp. TaxID=1903071 RepID=UPI0035653E10
MKLLRNLLTGEWLPSVWKLRPNYTEVVERYGRAGLFKTDQTLEAVASYRIAGFVAVISEECSPASTLVVHSLNVLGCAAVAPSDFDVYFPKFSMPDSRKRAFHDTMLDQASQIVVVPYDGWQSDHAVWRAVNSALRVNKRVSVIQPMVTIGW